MAWNPSPEVAVARGAAKRLGDLAKNTTEKCIVLYELADGRFGYASYGRTPNLCREARGLAESIYEFCTVVKPAKPVGIQDTVNAATVLKP